MKIHMMLAHNLMACYVTTLTGLRKKAKKENERHYVKRKTAMAGVFAGEALSGMIWAILRELDLTL